MKADRHRINQYQLLIAQIHKDLGISPNYAEERYLTIQYEPDPTELIVIENDVFDRPQKLVRIAAEQWSKMKAAAAKDEIELLVVSAFRSAEYQKKLFENKLSKNQAIDAILKVNAAPGYSEHHTGNALDITTPDSEPLSEAFENTLAFGWLVSNAQQFGFYMSYPRDNKHQFVYEPWHWVYGKC